MAYTDYIETQEAVWFTSLPCTWQATKMRKVFSERNTKVSDKDYPALSVGKMGVVPQLDTAVKTDNGDNRKLICQGDFAINSRSDRKGSSGVSGYTGSASLIITVLKPHHELNGKFYHYLLRSHYFVEEFYRNGHGLVSDLWTTKWDEMRNIYIPVPPREEQDQIVRYLDWKVSQINKLIHGYQRQIALIEEKKRSFTFTVVTQGIERSADIKISDIYWLKDIPAHWESKSIAQIFDEVKCKNVGMREQNLLSLSYGNIKRRDINATEGLLPESFEGYNIIEKDDIVLRLTDLQNDHKSLRTGIAKEKGIITSAYLTIRNKSKNNPEYLQLFLHAFDLAKGFYNVGASGVRQSLNWDAVKVLKILIPPILEQNKIVEAVAQEYKKAETATASIQKKIDLLKEYRTRLISDVVTGQIDVRDVVIPDYEPEEDGESEEPENEESEIEESVEA
jgi:type I restriction enzyme S subunit